MRSRRSKPSSRRGLEQRLLSRWRKLELPDGTSIVVGFSGGPDSLALAACLAALRPLLNADVRLMHVDHGLRPTSSEDAERAMALATTLGLDSRVVRIDQAALAAHSGVGLEEAARRERYRCFANVVARDTRQIVALGHHQADQAETVLLHLLRGAGVRGAAAMAELSEIVVPWWEKGPASSGQRVSVWRPLLSEPRDVVRDYTHLLGLTPVEDETNQSIGFQRNAIRHRLLPVMEQVSPGAVGSLARFAALASEDDRYMAGEAKRVLTGARSGPDSLSIEPLVRAPVSLRRRAILIWLTETFAIDPSQDRVDAVLELIEWRRRGPKTEVGGGYRATIVGADLLVRRD